MPLTVKKTGVVEVTDTMFCLGDRQRPFISGYNALLSSSATGSESRKYSGNG